MLEINKIYRLDALDGLKQLPDESVDSVVTSPPYWNLRDYGVEGQIGLEGNFEEYLNKLLRVFDEVKRVLRRDGTCWTNLGDSYGGSSNKVSYKKRYRGKTSIVSDNSTSPACEHVRGRWDKCLLGIPERFMLRMLERGWILRNKIIWHKPNALPSGVKDRFANSWQYIFLFVKSPNYYFDLDAVREPHKRGIPKVECHDGQCASISESPGGRNPGDFVSLSCNADSSSPDDCWSIAKKPFRHAHYAVFPEKLIERPIKTTPSWICKRCGEPRRRITRTERTNAVNNISPSALRAKLSGDGLAQPLLRYEARHFTIGWRECDCLAGFRPALILDPFMGSGTTAIVAKKLGRDFIGFELNADYVALANSRLKDLEVTTTARKEAA